MHAESETFKYSYGKQYWQNTSELNHYTYYFTEQSIIIPKYPIEHNRIHSQVDKQLRLKILLNFFDDNIIEINTLLEEYEQCVAISLEDMKTCEC